MANKKRSKGTGKETGLTQLNKINRKEALKAVDEVTPGRKALGWIWVKKGNTAKQVSPENLQKNLDDNWKIK